MKFKKSIAALLSLAMSVSVMTTAASVSVAAENTAEEWKYPTLPDGYLEQLMEQAAQDIGANAEQTEDGEIYYGDEYNTMTYVKYWIDARNQDFDKFKAAADKVLELVDPSWDDITKVVFFHDYIALNTVYDHTLASTSAYDVLVNGEGICQSYTMAMWYLLDRVGIESRAIISYDLDHGWNCIRLNGSWYMTDITWDDYTWGEQNTLSDVSHEFLLKSDKSFGHVENSEGKAIDDWIYADYQYNDRKFVSAMNQCSNNRFDDYFWNDTRKAIVIGGSSLFYYMDKNGLNKGDSNNNTSLLVDTSASNWNYYGPGFGTALGYGNSVIFSTPSVIYGYNTTNGKVSQIYELTDQEFSDQGSIYDMGLNGNTLTYRLTTTPNYTIPGYEKKYYDKKLTIDNNLFADREAIERFVDRLYTIILDRHAEADGLADWTNRLISGTATSAEIVYGIINSQEFSNKGLSNEGTIDRLYQAMLGRSADAAGKQYWINQLAGGLTMTGIINGFSGSQEFGQICADYGIKAGNITSCEPRDRNIGLTAFVSRMYTKALGRNYDVDGLNDWTNQYLTRTATTANIAYGFIFSEEFKNKNLSDEAYVETLYATFFDRPSDAKGKADWLDRMHTQGYSREMVLDGFLEAQEFINLKAGFGV